MQIPIEIDHGSRQSLQGQIFGHFRQRILCGGLKAGTPVPASRALAEQLGVSRNTVLLAYDRLIAEGYFQARGAIGTYVSFELPEACLAVVRPVASPSPAHGESSAYLPIPFFGQPQAVVSAQRLAFDFWLGRPDSHSFPIKAWRRLTNKALATAGARLTEYRDPGGLPELRQAIADHLGAARGVSVSPDQVIITASSQAALNVVARLLVREGTPVVTENPCYQGAAFLFESYYAKMVPAPVDEAGLDVEQLPKIGAMLVYVTPLASVPPGLHAITRAPAQADRLGAALRRVHHRGRL
jgi:GntR family transcriptional regulator / MocR family aminotransferase